MYDHEIHRARSAELRRSAAEYRTARAATAARRARRRGDADEGGAATRRGNWVKAA
ncbi:hypothetical protein [Streptomyces sp. MAR4 CNX-425]|uniref:hypothetical protein n=1 Tax=Streptomyces sp. MAR4 CNX-425 TaxID=3406343 RepID=UPI003B504308